MQLRIMSQKISPIPKNPALKPASDFYRLRREGIEFIEQMGSASWTDYNTHDPGITLLEALCYAITDLAFRTGRDIRDILTPAKISTDKTKPYPGQAFFTPSEILTVNPFTVADFRKLLIDVDALRNAWLVCRDCDRFVRFYAWCTNDSLTVSYQPPADTTINPAILSAGGLCDVLLELEHDPEFGDLNLPKVESFYYEYDANGAPHKVTAEIRFDQLSQLSEEVRELLTANSDAFAGKNGKSVAVTLTSFGTIEGFNLFTDPAYNTDGRNNYLRRQWRKLFYTDFEITIIPGSQKISLNGITLRLTGDAFTREKCTAQRIEALLCDTSPGGPVPLYRNRELKAAAAVAEARELMLSHRNLCEDTGLLQRVSIEEIAVCADVEIAPGADIEKVQAEIWFTIENYLNPPVQFYSLKELLAEKVPVEDIFEGPVLKNGFILNSDLAAADLTTMVRASDIINLLMEIDGVKAVNNLALSKYNQRGELVKGAADPEWVDGVPVYDPSKSSAQWLLAISPQHQPRLYYNLSRFLFFRDGLPYIPRTDEALDVHNQLKGAQSKPRAATGENDLYPPAGNYMDAGNYMPVQHTLPLIYGTGPEGLPGPASEMRKAGARQLKAYLMVYEQLLGNAFAQLAHAGDLFSIDPAVDSTYFVTEFTEALICGYNDIVSGLTASRLKEMTEKPNEFEKRRNQFLDHLLARFGEQYSEYTLLLNSLKGQNRAAVELIESKTAFLRSYPKLSSGRARAFNYLKPALPSNRAVIQQRLDLLLGYPDLESDFTPQQISAGNFKVNYQIIQAGIRLRCAGELTLIAASAEHAIAEASQFLLKRMCMPAAWQVTNNNGLYTVALLLQGGQIAGNLPESFPTLNDAFSAIEMLSGWAAGRRSLLIEHILLRPKFMGDALYPVCSDSPCLACSDDDPYSFRITCLMPGFTGPFSLNMDMRRFADRTIKQQLPSHLLAKVCWAGNDGFALNPCDPVISELSQLIEECAIRSGIADADYEKICSCAETYYATCADLFASWYEPLILQTLHADAVKAALLVIFEPVSPDSECNFAMDDALKAQLLQSIAVHFTGIAIKGYQFERFELAWQTWLRENAAFSSSGYQLQNSLETLYHSLLIDAQTLSRAEICALTKLTLEKTGAIYRQWIQSLYKSGAQESELPAFTGSVAEINPAAAFVSGAGNTIVSWLNSWYSAAAAVSLALNRVVHLLADIENTYPGATLHDCDDGSDENPVRLGSTSLGSNPMRRSLFEEQIQIITAPALSKAKSKKKPAKKSSNTSGKGKTTREK